MNKLIKKILFCFIFLFVLSFSFFMVDVGANTCTCNPGDVLMSSKTKDDGSLECVCENPSNTKCTDYYDSEGKVILSAIAEKYNATIKDAGNNQWKVSINPSDTNDSTVLNKLRNVRFKLMKVNGKAVTYDAYVSYDSPLIVSELLDSEGYMTLNFRVDKNHLDPDCKSEFLEFELEVFDGGDPKYENETLPDITIIEPVPTDTIDCSRASGEFELNFCQAKNNAGNLNYADQFNNGLKYEGKFGVNTYTKFTCNSSIVRSKDYVSAHGEEGYYLQENTSYMYGSGTYTMNFGQYQYHYRPYSPTAGATVSCKIKCEEAITVKYGAPVASKAGLCFEYKVKVISRTTCKMVEEPVKPQTNSTVCTPKPTCTGIGKSGNRYYLTQGGPNEDFDRCIEACDGGKYTSSCSKQCYKEVYQSSLLSYSPKKTANNPYAGLCDRGCYTSSSSWDGGGAARWYGYRCNPGYIPDSNGICRHDYGNGNICQDDCWWSGCSGNVYLNPGFPQADYQVNMEKYQNAINKCNAAISCSTETAEFTISVDYKDGSNTIKTVSFPYNGSNSATDKVNPSTINNKNTTLLRAQGCYDTPKTSESLYLVEWGFPGSWINRKTGELSYLDKTGSAGWQFISNKFCIPFDAQDVNVDWWNYYYTKLGKNPTCPQNSVPAVDYNINAKAKNFGYYGWNIEVDCFYAINNTEKLPCNPPQPNAPNDEIKYVVRSIDLEDVFPNTDGVEITDPGSEVGRTPGFNWSELATNNKNSNYTSSPLDYAKRIQEKGYTIYSDDEQLDYKFRLTPTVLNELKNARSSDYTLYNGNNYTDDNGVIRYRSNLPLLSDNTITLKKPNGSALKCNNMIARSGCETH